MSDLAALRRAGALEGLEIPEACGCERLRGHASTRSFFRLSGPIRAVLVVYPEEAEPGEVDRYRATRDFFAAAGVRVPAIRASGARALVVEDGGDLMLDAAAGSEPQPRLYRQAARVVARLQQHGARAVAPNPDLALDARRLTAELEFMEEYTIRGWLGATTGGGGRAAGYQRLADAASALPTAQCHRDFHARNLMVRRERIVVIDFQDVMAGPWLYDAAALLDDNYRDVGRIERSVFLRELWPAIRRPLESRPDFGVPDGPPGLPAAARQAFALVSLQRSLKALGTFGYQVTVGGQPDYARYAPRTWRNARRALDELGWVELLEALAPLDDLTA